MEHELKCDPEPFDALRRGEKTFEIRYNDRNFQVGDIIQLRRTEHTGLRMKMLGKPLIYTGEVERRNITHILRHDWDFPSLSPGLDHGYVILSLSPITPCIPAELRPENLEKLMPLIREQHSVTVSNDS